MPDAASNPEPLLVSAALLRQAAERCRGHLAEDPDNRTVLSSLALICRKQGHLDEAEALYGRLALLDPDDRNTQYLHAVLAGTDVPALPAGFRPAPFVLVKDFLPTSFHATLLPFVLSVRGKLVPARIATGVKHGEYKPETRESLDLPGEWEVKRHFRECLNAIIPSALSRLHVAPFEMCPAEVKVRAYLDGHFFRMHMDCPADVVDIAHRKVSYVYFFHKLPRGYTGGDLLLFDSNIESNRFTTSRFTSIVPEDNTLIIFPSPYFHSVIPVGCSSRRYEDSRFVINGHISSTTSGVDVAAGDGHDGAPPLGDVV